MVHQPSPRDVRWDGAISTVTGAISGLLKDRGFWERRNEVAWYVDLCVAAGFCKTNNDMRMCAERYLAGKRKVTPPGTARRKKMLKERKVVMANVPAELLHAVEAAVALNQKAADQFRAGSEKAINSIVGHVVRTHRFDPSIIRELIVGVIARH